MSTTPPLATSPGTTSPARAASGLPDPQQQKLHNATQGFEAIFLRQMLASARAADFGGDGLFDSDEAKQIAQMTDEKVADVASKSGAFGIARTLESQLAHLVAQPGTTRLTK